LNLLAASRNGLNFNCVHGSKKNQTQGSPDEAEEKIFSARQSQEDCPAASASHCAAARTIAGNAG